METANCEMIFSVVSSMFMVLKMGAVTFSFYTGCAGVHTHAFDPVSCFLFLTLVLSVIMCSLSHDRVWMSEE